MRRIGLVALAAWALAGSAMAGPQQFDLVCTPEGGAATFKMSVDLATGAWCDQPCAGLRQISRVQPGVIHFEEGEPPWFQVGGSLQFLVNRTDGGFLRQGADGVSQGKCEPAPFTPFPANKF